MMNALTTIEVNNRAAKPMDHLSDAKMKECFFKFFGRQPQVVAKAPGRVNLIGEHTDYNGGFVLPAAINYYTYVTASPRPDNLIRVIAGNYANAEVLIPLEETQHPDATHPWSNYIRGLIQQLIRAGFTLVGADLYIAGDLPSGAGLSSSASLEMALIRALLSISGEIIDPTQAALLGQATENQFVGCNCGIMDQLVSARGHANSALLIDCQDLSVRPVPIPADWEILIIHSGVKRGLVGSEYNQRRQQCERAAAYFDKSCLRGLSLAELGSAKGTLDDLSFRRARHVLTENARTLRAADALATEDFPSLIQAMDESHQSMRDDFEITTPAVDRLVNIIAAAGEGRAGARMTGGGFGGCVIAVAPTGLTPRLVSAVQQDYQRETGCVPTFIRAKASAGAFNI